MNSLSNLLRSSMANFKVTLLALSIWSGFYSFFLLQRVHAQSVPNVLSFRTIDIVLPESDNKDLKDLLITFEYEKNIEGTEIILTDETGTAVDSKPIDKSGKVLFKKISSDKPYALLASENVIIKKQYHQWLFSIESFSSHEKSENQEFSSLIKVIDMKTGRAVSGIKVQLQSNIDHTELNTKFTDQQGQVIFERLNTSRDFKVHVESTLNDDLTIIYLNERKLTPIKRITAI